MSNNAEMLAEEDTFEEMGNTYQLDTTEYDENDECTVEYLDLDLEVDSIVESTEEYIQDVPALKTKPRIYQSSVLKTSYLEAAKLKHKHTQNQQQDGRTVLASPSSTVQARSSTEDIVNPNSLNRTGKKRSHSLASETVHAAVNAINAKLANSAQSVNGQGCNMGSTQSLEMQSMLHAASSEDSEPSEATKTSIKSDCDSLDLFFQSMAQTVLHLPSQVQAKIKMDICKVIAMAEIKYCSSDAVPDASKF